MALKRTPGAGRERVIDPDNLTSPACAPEAYGGPAGGDDEANSNPITGDCSNRSSSLQTSIVNDHGGTTSLYLGSDVMGGGSG